MGSPDDDWAKGTEMPGSPVAFWSGVNAATWISRSMSTS